MLPLLFFIQIASVSPNAGLEQWPSARAGKVIATPDWSDYRIYPTAARAKNEEGRVQPEILVDVDGKPKACRILLSSNFPELDEGSCHLMMKMRFEPARDSTGHAITSYYSRPLIWLLDDPRPFASSSLKVRMTVQDGRWRTCEPVGGEGPYVQAWSAEACVVLSDVQLAFPDSASRALNAEIEVRLDAGDQASFLSNPWPSGEPVALKKIAFSVNEKGDPIACATVEARGFGPDGLNNLSPCGGLLSGLWFKSPPAGATPPKGTIETRVYVLSDD